MENTNKKLVLRSQAREVAANVYAHMKYEAEFGVERLTDARWRAAKAVGVSVKTISRILKEKATCEKTGTRMRSPHRYKNPRKRNKRDVDAFDKGVIRRTISNIHKQNKQYPTLQALKGVLAETINFDGCQETLRRILLDLGYEWVTTEDNRRALVEKHELQIQRYKYLKQLLAYRTEGRNIVFTAESCIQTSHGNAAQTKGSKGTRIITVHAGGRNGSIPHSSLIYKAGSCTDHSAKYKKWFTKNLLPNVPENSVIVMDNATYKTIFTDKIPFPRSDKEAMKKWLKSKNIEFDENMKKIELYDMIFKNKNDSKNVAIDEEAKKYKCDILRFPSNDPDLNPIDKIWDVVKNYVANKNADQNYETVVTLIKERLSLIDQTIWAATCNLVEDTELFYIKDYADEKELIIHIDESDSDSDTFVDSYNDEQI